MTSPAAASPVLKPSDFGQQLKDAEVTSGTRHIKRPFDAHSRDLARSAVEALDFVEDRATRYFHRLRQTVGVHGINAGVQDAFKHHREQCRESGSDASAHTAYTKLSQPRINNDASYDPESDGRSALEKFLPPNSRFRALLEPATGAIRDVHTGLHVDFRRKPLSNPTVYQLIFPGTGVVDTAGKQWLVNIAQFLGIGDVPHAYRQAAELATELAKSLPKGTPLELSGHSMGGGIATYVALKHDLKAVCLNAAMLGPACLSDLKKSNCLTPERLAKIHQLRIEGDPVTSQGLSKALTVMAALFAPAAVRRAPRLLGVVHQIKRGTPEYPSCNARLRHTTTGFTQALSARDKPIDSPAIKAPTTPDASQVAAFEALLRRVEQRDE